MKTNILTTAVALSDRDLLARIDALARTEREATAELVGHLAALELRPSLYAAQGYGSLFDYCTAALHLSEDAACTRIRVARTCRSFPVILDLLSSGALTMTSVRMLQPHLTQENHAEVLARATSKRLEDIQALVAELAPRPDVPATMRKLPGPVAPPTAVPAERTGTLTFDDGLVSGTDSLPQTDEAGSAEAAASPDAEAVANVGTGFALHAPSASVPRPPRPLLQALAPQRFRVQFTIGQETHDAVKRLQALMRRELPDADLAVIFDQGVRLLLEKVEKAKFGGAPKRCHQVRRARGRDSAYETRIRFKTDGAEHGRERPNSRSGGPETTQRERPSRHIPGAVKRAVWWRDGGQCAFVAANGRRCTERSFLELHHIHPHALDGPATVGNTALRCRRHNAYEAELVFGVAQPRRRPTESPV